MFTQKTWTRIKAFGNDFGFFAFRKPLLLACMLAFTGALHAELDFFPISTNSSAMGLAFDGSNFLVGLENHQTIPTTIEAQMISAGGTKVGGVIPIGRTGIAPAIAFDGTNYLLTWEDDGLGTWNGDTGWKVYGQFISKAGQKVGTPFAISTVGIWIDGIKTTGFGNGKYLITYTRLINPSLGGESHNRYVAGRIVNPDGTMGSEFRISTGHGKTAEVGFDGNNFFVVWCEDTKDTEIRGRFVSPAGVPGLEISVNASVSPSDNPMSVAFDGKNYLVAWNDEVGGFESGEWEAFGQLVAPNGTLVGEVVRIASAPGPQLVTSLASSGSDFFAIWIDMQNETNWDIYGQVVGRDGAVLGNKVTISTAPGNQMALASYAAGSYLLGVAHGVILGEGGLSKVDFTVGTRLAPAAVPQVITGDAYFGFRTNRFGFNLTGITGQTVVIEACGDLAEAAWQPIYTNTFKAEPLYFSDVIRSGSFGRFYRLRSP
jgi:hypothetical protein